MQTIRNVRAEHGQCAEVLAFRLQKRGLAVSPSGIGKVLRREKLTRKRVRLAKKDTWQPTTTLPGETIGIDVVYARKFKGKWLFQFTAVDCCTRLALLVDDGRTVQSDSSGVIAESD